MCSVFSFVFFFQAEDGIRDVAVTGVQTCALPICIGLILGLLTRLAALAVIIVMIGAIAKVHAKNGFFLNWELGPGKGHGYEVNLALIAMALACLLAGGGSVALDAVLGR